MLAAGRVRSKEKKIGRKNTKKSLATKNTPRNPQQPGDPDNLKTARDDTRATR